MFRHPKDRLPVFLILGVFAMDLTIFWTAQRWWVPVLWSTVMAIPKGWICSFNHHHQHLLTFRQPWLNRLLELVYGFQTGVTSHAWFLHHVVGHHVNYLDQQLDESRWQRPDGATMGEHEYSLRVALTAYPRAWKVGRRYPRARRIFLVMGLLQLVLLGAAFVIRPWNALWVFALPMMVSLYLTAWATYFHHAGLQTQDPMEGCYNILHPLYNLATGNLGYHTAHHWKHGMHWSELPALHAELEDRIPEHLYRQPGIPFVWFGTERRITLAEARSGRG
jgi:fatty acid desaturase